MPCRKEWFLILLMTCLITLLLAACSRLEDVADMGNLPFPREQVTNRWAVDGATLIERTSGYYTRGYYLLRNGKIKPIIGEACSVEFRENVDGRLNFTAHYWIDSYPISFPYVRWYDVHTEDEGTGIIYLGMKETGYWGQPGSDRLLSGLRIAENDVEFTFGVRKEAVPKFAGNPPWYFPFTRAASNAQTGELVFCFYQTEAEAEVFQAAEIFEGNALFASVRVEQREAGVPFSFEETAWWLRGLKPERVVPFPAVLVRLKPEKELSYTPAGSDTSLYPLDHDSDSPKDRKYTLQFKTVP